MKSMIVTILVVVIVAAIVLSANRCGPVLW
ncbi:hypothetical protein S1OALGB6SA_1696 [Olavius algarvensis spirochete endosymbiont]|nr:hypothetical protein S1OALGB6SA_1696 [Olavius algarvensis spirochete endosymbiont]